MIWHMANGSITYNIFISVALFLKPMQVCISALNSVSVGYLE